jgi:hypothetical protein
MGKKETEKEIIKNREGLLLKPVSAACLAERVGLSNKRIFFGPKEISDCWQTS